MMFHIRYIGRKEVNEENCILGITLVFYDYDWLHSINRLSIESRCFMLDTYKITQCNTHTQISEH